ncbi:MAG: hypothetical protein ACFFAU_06010 [Candidatus Hodarchaeota archaeon]
MTNEEIICCPICQTIYHSRHLSIWLKIKNKCPICGNKITNSYKEAIVCTKEIFQKKQTLSGHLPIRWNYLNLECVHCHNNIDLRVKTTSDQCKICGSSIFWVNKAQRLKLIKKNSNNIYYKNNRDRKPINKPQIKKINERKIKKIKEQERKRLQDFLQEQTRLELLDEVVLINQEYLRERKIDSIHRQNSAQEVIEESDRRKKSYVPSFKKTIVTFLVIQIIFLGILLFKLIK